MSFIKLTGTDSSTVLINPNAVTHITPSFDTIQNRTNSRVHFVGGNSLLVLGDPHQVNNIILAQHI